MIKNYHVQPQTTSIYRPFPGIYLKNKLLRKLINWFLTKIGAQEIFTTTTVHRIEIHTEHIAKLIQEIKYSQIRQGDKTTILIIGLEQFDKLCRTTSPLYRNLILNECAEYLGHKVIVTPYIDGVVLI